jgi:hypothetical protein
MWWCRERVIQRRCSGPHRACPRMRFTCVSVKHEQKQPTNARRRHAPRHAWSSSAREETLCAPPLFPLSSSCCPARRGQPYRRCAHGATVAEQAGCVHSRRAAQPACDSGASAEVACAQRAARALLGDAHAYRARARDVNAPSASTARAGRTHGTDATPRTRTQAPTCPTSALPPLSPCRAHTRREPACATTQAASQPARLLLTQPAGVA